MSERILITGGASGIGAACAARAREDGYEVVVIDREGEGIRADLSNSDETARALEEALSGGAITRLVNNVGAVFPAAAAEQTLEEFDRAVALNLRCAMQCFQAAFPSMKEAGFGRVVNISSRAALGKELRTAYAATKAGLIGMTRTWALETGRHGITVNAVGPGPIRTALFDQANPPDAPRTKAIIGRSSAEDGYAGRRRSRSQLPSRRPQRLRDRTGSLCMRRHDRRRCGGINSRHCSH